jgi:hypothetical protein
MAKLYAAENGLLVPLDGGTPIVPPGGGGGGGEPPPPGGSGILFGASVTAGATGQTFFNTTQATAGPWSVARRYQSGLFATTFAADSSGCADDIGKRMTVYSCKPDMTTMANGGYDARLTGFANSIPDSHPTVMICWHEPDVKFRQAGFDIPLWKQANTRFMSVLKALGKPHLYTAICLTNWSAIGGVPVSSQPPAFWFGPDGASRLIDIVAWDMYMTSNTITTAAHEQAAMVAFTDSHGAGYGISEIGIHDAVTNFTNVATWMHSQSDYAAATPCGPHDSAAFLTWFNSSNASALPVPSTDSHMMTASNQIATQYYMPYTEFVL